MELREYPLLPVIPSPRPRINLIGLQVLYVRVDVQHFADLFLIVLISACKFVFGFQILFQNFEFSVCVVFFRDVRALRLDKAWPGSHWP